jgi:short-subunit dehydrogenase
LGKRGLDLVLVARRRERLEQLASHLAQTSGVRVQVCQVDLADIDAAPRLCDATAAQDIGLVVSNAGFGMKGDFAAGDPNELSRMLMVNCHAPLLLVRGLIPRLRERGRGGVILVSSVEGLIGCPYSAAYSASKAFVKNLGEALWGELTPQGIDVLTVCPGATDTEALARSGVNRSALPNVMSPEDVATLALDGLGDGPVLIPSAHYKAMFDQLTAMPRRDALAMMAKRMKP